MHHNRGEAMNFIGLDIGTTGAKALLVDARGRVLGKGYAGYALHSDGARVEQRAGDWAECGAAAVRQALAGHDARQVAAVALSTQGASTVAVDAAMRPLGPALTWMDTRAVDEAAALEAALGGDYIYRNTGWRVSPSLDAAKIMHMKRTGEWRDAALFLSTLEYMNLFLAGAPVCDPTNAAMRQFFNVNTGEYDARILGAAGIDVAELPRVLPTGAPVGGVTADAADATGLPVGTPVYNGAHDQYCASIGAACIAAGDLLLSAGTTWVLMGIGSKPLFTDTFISPAPHPVPGLYGAIASLVGSGASLQWFKENFLDEEFDELNTAVAKRGGKAHDLLFYPYLSGAYYPLWELQARGAFAGISLAHDRFDFARAIMEATAFGVRQTVADFAKNGVAPQSLRIMGGAAKSEVWCELIAAAAGLPLDVSGESEACALGAAMIAATGHGAYESLAGAAAVMAAETRAVAPQGALAEAMDEKFGRWQRMWGCMGAFYGG